MSIFWAKVLWSALFSGLGAGLGQLLSNLIRLESEQKKKIVRTVLVAGFIVAGYGIASQIPPPFADTSEVDKQINQTLSGETFFKYILEDFPHLRPGIEDKLRAAYVKGGAAGLTNETVLISQSLGGDYVVRYVPKASDDAIDDFINSFYEMIEFLSQEDPVLCHHWMHGGLPDLGARSSIPPTLDAKMNFVMINIIKSSREISTDRQLMTDEEFQTLMLVVVDRLSKNYPSEDVDLALMGSPLLVKTNDDKRKSCLSIRALYKEVKTLPNPDRVRLFRTLYSKLPSNN